MAPRRLVDIDVHEVSIVDRGANRAKFCVLKAASGDPDALVLADLEKKGEDMTTCPKCGAELKKGAKACPDCGAEVTKEGGDMPETIEAAVTKAMKDGKLDVTALPEAVRGPVEALVTKAATEAAEKAKADAKAEAEPKFAALEQRVGAAEKVAADEREIRVTKEMADRAGAADLKAIPGSVEDRQKLFRKLHDAGLLSEVEGILKAAAALITTQATTLVTHGVTKAADLTGSAEEKMNRLATEKVEKARTAGKAMSFGEAMAEVTNEQPDLYEQYRTERSAAERR